MVGEDVGALVGETVVGEAVGEVVVGEEHAAGMLVPERLTDRAASPLGRLPHKPRLSRICLNKQNTKTEMAQCYRKTK